VEGASGGAELVQSDAVPLTGDYDTPSGDVEEHPMRRAAASSPPKRLCGLLARPSEFQRRT